MNVNASDKLRKPTNGHLYWDLGFWKLHSPMSDHGGPFYRWPIRGKGGEGLREAEHG